MINKIQIRGFRKHKKLSVEFGPNVNSIIGQSAAGKSALIRALRWAAINKPTGTDFINWDLKKSAVRITLDKREITRTRSKSTNLYHLDEKEFAAFGNEVPEEIQRLLNLSHINWQGQHSAPFWFCETAGEVSRQLNSIIDLEIIDRTLASITANQRTAKTNKELTETRLENAAKEVKALAYAEDIDVDLTSIEQKESRINEIARGSLLLDDLLKRVLTYGSERDRAADTANSGKIAIDLARSHRETWKARHTLSEWLETAEISIKEIKRRPPPFQPIEEIQNRLTILHRRCDALEDVIEEIETYEERLCEAETVLKDKKSKFKKVVGDRCPICGKSLTKKS